MCRDLLLCFVIGFRCSRGLSSLQASYLAVIGHIVYLVLFMRCKNFQLKSKVFYVVFYKHSSIGYFCIIGYCNIATMCGNAQSYKSISRGSLINKIYITILFV